jgi:hypothetical protein
MSRLTLFLRNEIFHYCALDQRGDFGWDLSILRDNKREWIRSPWRKDGVFRLGSITKAN